MKAVRAAIGLGSNLSNERGDPFAHIQSALRALAGLAETRFIHQSSTYRSAPLSGAGSQPDYANAAAVIETRLAPLELLNELLSIERVHGRVRDGTRWAPRLLDLDLLLYGDLCLDHPQLRIPHPELARRDFVLEPLAEIAADWWLPGLALGRTSVADLRAALGSRPLPRWG